MRYKIGIGEFEQSKNWVQFVRHGGPNLILVDLEAAKVNPVCQSIRCMLPSEEAYPFQPLRIDSKFVEDVEAIAAKDRYVLSTWLAAWMRWAIDNCENPYFCIRKELESDFDSLKGYTYYIRKEQEQ